jgi:DNA (cytosine-5)-methyltransferase 1
VLDAQYFGVAQRRRRVFVVGYLGDWKPAAKVLFESESLRRNIKKSKIKGEEIAGTITARFGRSRNNHEELAPTLTSSYGKSSGQDMQPGLIQPVYSSEKSATLTSSAAGFSRPGGSSTSHENYIAQTITFPADMNFFSGFDNNIANTLLRKGNMAIALAENTIGRKPENGGNGDGYSKELSYTLNATGVHGVAHPISWDSELNPNVDKMGTLMRGGQGGRTDGVMQTNMAVRRLTPIECERLQGFPDSYTNIKENCPDGPRYKALGNSMAVPVMKWIGQRINELS